MRNRAWYSCQISWAEFSSRFVGILVIKADVWEIQIFLQSLDSVCTSQQEKETIPAVPCPVLHNEEWRYQCWLLEGANLELFNYRDVFFMCADWITERRQRGCCPAWIARRLSLYLLEWVAERRYLQFSLLLWMLSEENLSGGLRYAPLK